MRRPEKAQLPDGTGQLVRTFDNMMLSLEMKLRASSAPVDLLTRDSVHMFPSSVRLLRGVPYVVLMCSLCGPYVVLMCLLCGPFVLFCVVLCSSLSFCACCVGVVMCVGVVCPLCPLCPLCPYSVYLSLCVRCTVTVTDDRDNTNSDTRHHTTPHDTEHEHRTRREQ